MAYHFSANQFEDQYNARKLGNWEYPKWYPERPRQRSKPTKIIANDNGHLLEGIKRENPWGNYIGTWDLPRRITRDFAEKLAAPPERAKGRWHKKQQPTKGEKVKPSDEQEQETKLGTACCQDAEKSLSEREVLSEDFEKPLIKNEECMRQKQLMPALVSQHLPVLQKVGSLTPLDSFQKRNRSSSALDLRPKLEQLTPKISSKSDKESGDLTDKVKSLIESVEEKKTPPPGIGEICPEIKALPPAWKEKSPVVDSFNPVPKSRGSQDYNQYLENHLSNFEQDKSEVEVEEEEEEEEKNVDVTERQKPPSPEMEKAPSPVKITPRYQIAKRYQEDNLKHQPLPDVIEDPVFKALGSSRHPNPGSQLNLQPNAVAIGWRGHAAPGPTQCSKMRIYRPKTAVAEQMKSFKNPRPKTSEPKLIDKHFTPMELAICWDLIPEDPSDEPKRSPHIDGSNGSVAPAVFSIVKPEDGVKQNFNSSPQAVAERILPDIQNDNAANLPVKCERVPIGTNKEAIMTHIKTKGTPDSLNSITSSAAEIARKNPKTAWTGTDTSKTLSKKLMDLQKENKNPNIMNGSRRNTIESDMSNLSRKKQYQSSPNLVSAGCQTSRRCSGSNCGTEKSSIKGNGKETKIERKKIRSCDCCDRIEPNASLNKNREKTEFKGAFKAGVPNNGSSHSTTPQSDKPLKIPKMRLPYAKRSYSISTLIPPFSLWPRHGQDYPDHWRLASVYQHSYKPIDYRKKSLLASIYQ